MVSQRGTLNLFHTEAQRDLFVRRANMMRQLGVDAEALDRQSVRDLVPLVDLDNGRYPVLGGFLQRRGGTVRHDAVAWATRARHPMRASTSSSIAKSPAFSAQVPGSPESRRLEARSPPIRFASP